MTPPPTEPELPTADATGRLLATVPAVDLGDPPVTRPVAVGADLPNTLLLRRPDATRDDEKALVEGQRTARRDALDRLAGWFPGIDAARLADHPGQVEPTPTTVDPSRLAALELPALVDRLLAEHHMGAPKLIVATNGEPEHKVPPDTVVVPPSGRYDHPHALAGPLARLLADGTTVIIHAAHVHDDGLADVTEALAVALGTQVGANLYVSRGDAPGFGPHWDEHDVLIVQAEGAKRWEVFEPTAAAPLTPVVAPAIGATPAWDGTLEPGQALYVPRGWGHRVSGSSELSIHATLTLQRLRVDQVAAFASGLGGFWPLFRADVPFALDGQVASYAGSLYDEPGRFAAAVTELGHAGALEHATAQWLAKLPHRRRGRLSTTVAAMQRTDWSAVTLQGSFPGGVAVMDEKADPRLVASAGDDADLGADRAARPVLATGGRLLELEAWAVPALAELLGGRPVRVADLPLGPSAPDGLDDATRRSVLASALVGLGVVEVVDITDAR